jgi:hypothetical protein
MLWPNLDTICLKAHQEKEKLNQKVSDLTLTTGSDDVFHVRDINAACHKHSCTIMYTFHKPNTKHRFC